MRLARLFSLALLSILGLTLALASEVMVGEWRRYSESSAGLEAARTFMQTLQTAERLSAERDPSDGILAAPAGQTTAWAGRLADSRAATDAAFEQLSAELRASSALDIKDALRVAGAVRARLAISRSDIDRLAAQPKAARDLDAIRGLVLRMVALVSDLAPILNATELAVGAADPRLFKLTAVARTAAELRELASQLGGSFAAPLAGGVPFSAAESFAVERLTGRITALAQQLDSLVEVAQVPAISDAMASMNEIYLEAAMSLVERLTASGRADGRYPMSTDRFLENYVPATRTIIVVRNAALNQLFASAELRREQAARSLATGVAIVAVTFIMVVAIGLLLRRRVIAPLLALTEIMSRIVKRIEVTVPGTTRRDEIGEMARAVKVFQSDAHENDRLRAETEAATRAKSAFLAMMSHEIRTPMNGVMSMAEMLDQTELTEDQRGMSSVIRSSAAALLTIINDILDFSKIEAGKLEIETVPFSLSEVVEEAGELVASRTEDKAIDLIIDIDPAIPSRVVGDPTRLRQVLLNLMGNAVKFTDRGSVTVRVRPARASDGLLRARVEVIDTGVGLTAEQRGKLFQPFVQADTSTSRKYGGTGLGLSICQRLCDMMGGRIGVDSEYGKGSMFWFELPFPIADDALDRPTIAIDDACVVAIGVEGQERAVLSSILTAAGIARIDWVDLPAAREAGAAVGPETIVMVRARPGDQTALDTVRGMAHRPDAPRVVLLAPRGLASTLASAGAQGAFATLSLPMRRHRVWHTLAAALDRASLSQRQGTQESNAVGWAPPDLDMARAARALILVAEDNPTNQVVVRRLLTQRGYALEIAGNGVEALRLYQQNRDGYGLLLTDFHMPQMDGFTLAREIRRHEEGTGQRLAIVALTADALPGTEKLCLEAGMDGYLTKPINSHALTEALEKFVPQALELRQRADSGPSPARSPAVPAIDSEILDLAHLSEMFGGLNEEARAFIVSFVGDVPNMIDAIGVGLAAGDSLQAREAAHALKGAARSAGARRLGRIAADLQDRLDDNDLDTAGVLFQALPSTHAELNAATEGLRPVAV